ncbi:unnamed protein product, partial [Ixodes hexagonus]
AAQPFVFDLDEKVKKLVESKTPYTCKGKLLWWDMYGQHQILKKNAHKWGQFKVTVKAEPVKYGKLKNKVMRPVVVFSQWSHNGQPKQNVKVSVKRETTRQKTATWNTEFGFRSSLSVRARAGIPIFASIESKLEVGLDYKSKNGGKVTETQKLSVNQEVIVPPMKSVKIEWIVTEGVQDVPWTAAIKLGGWVAAQCASRKLYFYPIHRLSSDPLVKYVGHNTVQYTAKGLFTAVSAHESHLRVSEFDLQAYDGRATGAKTYTIPLNVTQ